MILSHVLHIPKNKAHGRKVFSTDGTGRLTLLIQTKNTYMYARMLGLMKFMAESESESLDSEKQYTCMPALQLSTQTGHLAVKHRIWLQLVRNSEWRPEHCPSFTMSKTNHDLPSVHAAALLHLDRQYSAEPY